MPQSKGPFYMTTAIAYTSGKPHIGNTYEIVLADSIARFRRQEGYDVFSRQELTSMVRRLSLRLKKLELHLRNLLTMFQQKSREYGIL